MVEVPRLMNTIIGDRPFAVLDEAVRTIASQPESGETKVGDL